MGRGVTRTVREAALNAAVTLFAAHNPTQEKLFSWAAAMERYIHTGDHRPPAEKRKAIV